MDSITCPLAAMTAGLPFVFQGSKGLSAPTFQRQVSRYAQVTGGVTVDGQVMIEPLRIISTDRQLTAMPEPGPYTLTFKEIDGHTLAEYQFSLNPGTHPREGETTPFLITVPYPALTARVLISLDGKPQAELARSASEPVVSLLSPNESGELSGKQTITWEASDADGNSILFYDVDYSPDGGETWLPLGAYIAETSLTVDFDAVPGGEEALLRVTASDGWNTGEDISDINFTVPRHGPEITVLGPLDGTSFYETQPFYVEATAFDWEDGPITDLENFTWTSDVDGVLATGPWTSLAEMTPGDHSLTIQVTDSDGNVSEASVHVSILSVEQPTATNQPITPSPTPVADNSWLFILSGLGVFILVLLIVLSLGRSRRSKKE
jgi:hypothetical protein